MNSLLVETDAPKTTIVDELDREESPDLNGSPPIALPPLRPSQAEPSEQSLPESRLRVLARLLAMADTYRESGSLRQAIEMYFELIRDHADTPQALQAEKRLMGVARSYEQAGELRQARGIYEQLL